MAKTETRVRRLSQMKVTTGAPIKVELFAGKREALLAKTVGVTQFGVNHVTLEPGSISSLRHWHEGEDEFVYVLSGQVALIDDNGEHTLETGAFAGFPADAPNAHHFMNKSAAPAILLVVGTRLRGKETIHYPDDNLGPVTVTRDAAGERVKS
jgi:uncharacterized cupin superfamily protein